ncbi:MAG TPA: proline iminopeptidase-family hydrolase [Ktedonobacterales bacterium]
MTAAQPVTEGYIPFKGYRTWYQIVGDAANDAARPPLLALHGGPGAPHDYLENMAKLAEGGRRVIFYDQLGCGRSDKTGKPEFYTVELFIEELGEVRRALGLERIHLLGQSWGGMLAMAYMLTQPKGIASLLIESSPASMPLWAQEANRLRDELPPDIQATLLKHEANGTTDSPDYLTAMQVFYDRHVCRITPLPNFVQRAFDTISPEVYGTMNGPSEFHVIGTLKDWDITRRLGEINVPTLLLSGRHDEATPTIMGKVHAGIRGSEWVIFEQSSHLCHVEEEARWMAVVGDWLRAHDQA